MSTLKGYAVVIAALFWAVTPANAVVVSLDNDLDGDGVENVIDASPSIDNALIADVDGDGVLTPIDPNDTDASIQTFDPSVGGFSAGSNASTLVGEALVFDIGWAQAQNTPWALLTLTATDGTTGFVAGAQGGFITVELDPADFPLLNTPGTFFITAFLSHAATGTQTIVATDALTVTVEAPIPLPPSALLLVASLGALVIKRRLQNHA